MSGNSVDPDETPRLRRLIWVYTVSLGLSDQIHTVKYNVGKSHAQTDKSSMITKR